MLMMALFTVFWTQVASLGMDDATSRLVVWIFFVYSGLLTICAACSFSASSRFSSTDTTTDYAAYRGQGILYGIVITCELLLLFAVTTVLLSPEQWNGAIPVIALATGLHFYPVAWAFRRNTAYYLAAWTCFVTLTGMYILAGGETPGRAYMLIGAGAALATAVCGIDMMCACYVMIRKNGITIP